MTVYVIADIKVTDDGWIPGYAASVHELVHKHGGKYLSRSGNVKTLEGKPLDTTFIVRCTGTMRAASLCAPRREMPEAIRPCNARAGSFN
jgi:uncharacterized protein (DUF1330 family)